MISLGFLRKFFGFIEFRVIRNINSVNLYKLYYIQTIYTILSFTLDVDLSGGPPAGRLAGRVIEELELKPTQLKNDVRLGLELSFAISLSLNKLTVNNVTTFSHSILWHSWRNEGHKKCKDFQM